MKFLACAVVALLAVESITLAQGLEVRAAEPEALNLAARSKGLPPDFAARTILARQEPEAATTTPVAPTESSSVLSKAPPTPAVPTDSVDTILSKIPGASGSPSGASGAPAYYTPTGTGSLIPSWSALVAKGGVPTNQPTAPPTPPSTGKAADAPSSAHKIEAGLISGGLIAGIASLFF